MTRLTAPRMSRKRDAGFTLVEMLVALFAFSILSLASTTALTGSFRAKRLLDANIAEVEGLVLFDTLIRRDLAHAVTRPTRDAFGMPELQSFQTYPPDGALVVFTRDGRSNPEGLSPRGDLMRVGYLVEDGRLLRRTPILPTPIATTPTAERVLLEGVRDVDVSAWSGDQQLLQVSVPPGDDRALPDRLEMRIRFEDGREMTQILEIGS